MQEDMYTKDISINNRSFNTSNKTFSEGQPLEDSFQPNQLAGQGQDDYFNNNSQEG